MNTNTIAKYLLLLLLPAFAGCKKWLDVTPQTQVKEEEQFSTQQGFTDALFGIYTKAASQQLYGNNLSFGMLDVLAQYYENKSNTSTHYGQLARYNYTYNGTIGVNVQQMISDVWTNMYAAIAQANYILKNVDSRKDVLKGNIYNLVKGEALGLRAFMHFDLLRMFAPAWLDGANAQQPAIPYMEQFTVSPGQRLTVEGVLNKCEQDLLAAENLLAALPEIDQIADNQGITSLDLVTMYRQNHLNYWAVKAMLARLYLYKGEKEKAFAYANEVINSEKFRFMQPGEFSGDATLVTSDLTLSREHVFSLYVSDLKATADLLFKQSSKATETTDLFSTRAKLDAMHEASVPGYGSDIRRVDQQLFWTQITTSVVYSKKYHSDMPTNVKQRLVPVIRLPELYFIAAETAPATAEGVAYLNAVRTARLLPELATSLTAVELMAEIQKEYRKEMYGEGQLFYFYKRNNVVTIPDGVGNPMSEAKYVFPLPLAELEFGK